MIYCEEQGSASTTPVAAISNQCKNIRMVTLQMPILDHGADAWRLVEITPMEGGIYRVEGVMPPDETWSFPPGSLIQCRWKKFPDGRHELIPAGAAATVKTAFIDNAKINAGLCIGFMPVLSAIMMIPKGPDNRSQSAHFLLVCVVSVIFAIAVHYRFKPESLIGRWAIRSAIGFGVLFGSIALFDTIREM